MRLSENEQKLFELAMNASDVRLMSALGESLNSGEMGISLLTPEESIKYASKKLEEIKGKLKNLLCCSDFIEKIDNIDKTDSKKATIAILEILAGFLGVPPAIYASILISRTTLRRWCENDGAIRDMEAKK